MKITQRIIGAILGVSLLGGVATGVFLSPQNHDIEEVNAAGGYSCSEIIISDTLNWNIRTLWLDNFSYSTGYSKTDFIKFCETYYNSSISSWKKEGTTRGWKNYNDGFNLCSGGDSRTYSFLLPSWVDDCSIYIENNSNSRHVGSLKKVLQSSNNSNSNIGSSKDKTVTFVSQDWNGMHFQASIGSAKTTTDFESSVTFIAKTDASTEIARKTETVNKFEHVGDYSIDGYKFVDWYTDSNLTTSFSGLIASNTTLYAKFDELKDPLVSTNSFYVYDPHKVLGSSFENINVYGFGQDSTIKPMSWPGTHSGVSQVTLGKTSMYQVALSVSYPNFIMNCGGANPKQTVDVTDLSSNIGKVLVIDNTQTGGKYNVHWSDPEDYSDFPTTDGYYLLGDNSFVTATGGSGTSWKYATGVKMNTLSGQENKANYVLTVNITVNFKVRSYLNSTDSWLSFGATYNGNDGITTSGDDVQVVAGTYSIYVNKDSLVYVSKGIQLDTFCSTFLTKVANTCDAQTGNTDPNALHTLWEDLATLYNGVAADEKAKIVAITFNGGSDADDAHKVVKAYHYIVTKYGTTVCPDFIWGQTISSASANKVSTNYVTNNSVSVIVITFSLVTLTTVGAFFVLRKKKYN